MSLAKLLKEPRVLFTGGDETDIIYNFNTPINNFALFECLLDTEKRATLKAMLKTHAQVAKEHGICQVIGTPTWRASPEHMQSMGYQPTDVAKINMDASKFAFEVATEFFGPDNAFVFGDIGPRADGYTVDSKMSIDEAKTFHTTQIEALKKGGVLAIAALTLNYVDEAIGMVQAAKQADIPIFMSFTVETNGCLNLRKQKDDAGKRWWMVADCGVKIDAGFCDH
eukprot:m.161091 g.161091  ORF g.161091 m.161091 type:complete len:225 (+) comp24840_c0_seq5:79-753(+)